MALTDQKFYFGQGGGGATSNTDGTPVATVEAHIGYSASNPYVANPQSPVDVPNVAPSAAYTGTTLFATYVNGSIRFANPA